MRAVVRLKLVFNFSLAAWSVAALSAVDYGALQGELRSAAPDRRLAIARKIASRVRDDKTFNALITRALHDNVLTDSEIHRLDSELELRRIASIPLPRQSDAQELAKKIKSSGRYRDSSKEHSNWLSRAFSNFIDALFKSRGNTERTTDAPDASEDLEFLRLVIYTLGSLAVIAFLAFAVKSFARVRLSRRTRKALLDSGEPERTKDEWLELADRLIAEENYRGAIRCLYVACLLRLDELAILQFRKQETNWEHLKRAESSGKLPVTFPLRSLTAKFDDIWYGMAPHSFEDVAEFLKYYKQVASGEVFA